MRRLERVFAAAGVAVMLALLMGADTRTALTVGGPVANNVAATGNPQTDGAVAQADAANPTALNGGALGYLRQDTQGRLFVRNYGSNIFTCSVTTTATAVATITGCLSPGAGLARYITDVYIGGGVATGAAAAATITAGTGTTCGTGTATLFRCDHPATGNCTANQTTPIKAGVASDLCFTDAAVGTKNVTITGFIAP
jgi:hypothetical protein